MKKRLMAFLLAVIMLLAMPITVMAGPNGFPPPLDGPGPLSICIFWPGQYEPYECLPPVSTNPQTNRQSSQNHQGNQNQQ